jgi:type IV secretion system protein VirB10
MPVKEIGDPRLQALFGASDPRDVGVRPTMALPRKGLPPLAIVTGAILFAVLLFVVLNGRRTSQLEPTVRPGSAGEATAWQGPPPLYIPPALAPMSLPPSAEQQRPAIQAVIPSAPLNSRVQPQVIYAPQPLQQYVPAQQTGPIAPQQRVSAGAPLVIDVGGPGAPGSAAAVAPPAMGSSVAGVTRMHASALANPAMTVPQGYLIPAVLETGFNSTKPGFARAVVSRDVRGFDTRNVLIPRGSRLTGEYRSEIAQGQRRAVIIWNRLIRPDGITITMNSPAVDTLGRGGVAANVNNHFFERLGDALLQSTIDVGRAFAGRSVSNPVVIVPGNAAAATAQTSTATNYIPTLTVPAGKSISVFVAHDLDFGSAGSGQ